MELIPFGKGWKWRENFLSLKRELKNYCPWLKFHSFVRDKLVPQISFECSVGREKQLFSHPLESLFLQHDEWNYSYGLKSVRIYFRRKNFKTGQRLNTSLSKNARNLIVVHECGHLGINIEQYNYTIVYLSFYLV